MPVPGGNKVGRISKPYGLQGHVNLILDPVAGKHIKNDHPLFIDIEGQRVPFFIEDVEPVSADHAILKFEFLDSVEQAKTVSGCEVYLDPSYQPSSQDATDDYHAVIGYKALDQHNNHLGKVTGLYQYESNPLFRIEHHGKELLIPAVKDLIEQIDHRNRSIQYKLPEGLTSL